MAGSSGGPAPTQQHPKTKEEALWTCVDQHAVLVACFKTCAFASSFTGCCTKEHREFWKCYTRERGTNQTRITSWLDGFFGGRSAQPAGPQAAHQKQGSGGASAAAGKQQ